MGEMNHVSNAVGMALMELSRYRARHHYMTLTQYNCHQSLDVLKSIFC